MNHTSLLGPHADTRLPYHLITNIGRYAPDRYPQYPSGELIFVRFGASQSPKDCPGHDCTLKQCQETKSRVCACMSISSLIRNLLCLLLLFLALERDPYMVAGMLPTTSLFYGGEPKGTDM